jgi:peptidoglycan/LPS O-acetylase OafA/YrhL
MVLRRSLNEAGIQRPYLGNFDVHTGYPRFQASRAFAYWSDLKRRTFDQRGPRYFFTFLALAAAVAMLLATQRRSLQQGAVAGGVALIGMAFTALCVASLADALDVPRHHLLFYVLFDMLLVLLVHLSVGAWLARNWLARKRPRRNIAASADIGAGAGG